MGLSLVTDHSPFQALEFPEQTRILTQNTGWIIPQLRLEWGLDSCVVTGCHGNRFREVLGFDFTLRTDQKRFGFYFKIDSISTKIVTLHSRSLRLISERRVLNFSLRRLDALCFSFLRIESFLLMRFMMEPLIQGSGFVPLSFFFGIKSATAARTASFQQR